MKKYRVEYSIYEEVEAEDEKEAIEKALEQMCGCDWYVRNEISDHIQQNAYVYQLEEEE